jgi:hypothetical protein
MRERHIMLDIETLGNGSNACIVSIGAVELFVGQDACIGKTFEVVIDPEDSAQYGEIDASTVVWWLQQRDEARQRTFPPHGTKPLKLALILLGDFIGNQVSGVWGNGCTFDNVILHNACKKIGLPPLWSFRLDRDLRTMTWLSEMAGTKPAVPDTASTVAHAALDDALYQAHWLQNILSDLIKGE